MSAFTNVSDDADWVDPGANLTLRVRAWLVGVGVGLIAVFATAAWIRPYDENGNALRLRTHTQLGMSPCNFERMTGKPCPSCGMTTSFSLLMHGDVANSLRANWAGTLLAVVGLCALPWALISGCRGRAWLVYPQERATLVIVGGVAVLAILRWAGLMLGPTLFG